MKTAKTEGAKIFEQIRAAHIELMKAHAAAIEKYIANDQEYRTQLKHEHNAAEMYRATETPCKVYRIITEWISPGETDTSVYVYIKERDLYIARDSNYHEKRK